MTSHSVLRLAGAPLNLALSWICCYLVLVVAERDVGVYKAIREEVAQGAAVKPHGSLGGNVPPLLPLRTAALNKEHLADLGTVAVDLEEHDNDDAAASGKADSEKDVEHDGHNAGQSLAQKTATVINFCVGVKASTRVPGVFWSCDVMEKLKALPVMPDELKGLTESTGSAHRAAPLHCVTADQDQMFENAAQKAVGDVAEQVHKDAFKQQLYVMWINAGILQEARWSAEGIDFAKGNKFPMSSQPVEHHFLTQTECCVFEQRSMAPGSEGLKCDKAVARPAAENVVTNP